MVTMPHGSWTLSIISMEMEVYWVNKELTRAGNLVQHQGSAQISVAVMWDLRHIAQIA